ncbi:MAG: ATP-binding protein [Sphaerochaetaceae bacterium]|nr:ATP-binding protein [Sphaerochaetaceae bacterium]
MKIRSLRNQSILLILFILVITLLSMVLISQYTYLTSLKQQTYEDLESHNDFVSSLIEQTPGNPFETLDEYSSIHSIRITIIESDGTVAYDSDYDEMNLESHLFREEVQQSLKEGFGMSERRSATQEALVLYFSRYHAEAPYPFVRTSTPLDQLKEYRTLFDRLLWGNVFFLILVVTALTLLSIRKITKPISDLNMLAQMYEQGNLKAKRQIRGPKEITDLSLTMQKMASTLKGKIEELNSSRIMIETMINALSQGLLLLDNNLVIKIANTPSYELLMTKGSLEGRTISQIINSTRVLETIRNCKDEKTHTEITIEQYAHLFGETARIVGREKTRTLRFSVDPIDDESTSMSLVITITDMTELVKLEQMRKDFVANVSHELKTPITAIAGFSQTLLEEDEQQLNETQKRFLSIIHRQGQNMLSIVQDLLLLSSLEQKQSSLVQSWVEIEHVVEQSIGSCEYKSKEKNINIISHIENPENLPVFIHPVLIGQALTNLLSNAIAYSPEGRTVEVNTAVDEQNLEIKVMDKGYGIPESEQERIFERFYRVDTARSRALGGTGLGLSIVKHIAAAHHGTVKVESEPDKGSTFTITVDRKGGQFSQLEKSRKKIISN